MRQQELSSKGICHHPGGSGKFIHKEIDACKSIFTEILYVKAKHRSRYYKCTQMKMIQFLPSVSILVRKLLSPETMYTLGSNSFKKQRLYHFT